MNTPFRIPVEILDCNREEIPIDSPGGLCYSA
jgi:hypothetical protein